MTAVGLLCSATFVLGFGQGRASRSASTGGETFRMVEDAAERIRSSSLKPPSDDALARGAVAGMIGALGDSYAIYYSPNDFRAFQESIEGSFTEASLGAPGSGSDPRVSYRMLGGSVGYIALPVFHRGAGDKVRAAVRTLQARGAEGFVLDLRDDPGGLLVEAVRVAGVFFKDGPIVTYQKRGRQPVIYEAGGLSGRDSAAADVALVVLVNEKSASASEIVAGAVQDRGRGLIVGTTTFGKGSAQEVFDLARGAGLQLTTAVYLTPSGRSIHGVGIVPDIVIKGSKEAQLARAEGILHEMLGDLSVSRARG
ncbi:MAG: S41 family peptidase [Actinomycetota bacterium]